MFGDSGARRPFLIDVDGDLGKQLASLFRMKITRIQATYMPMQRRIPMDIPLTARGAALLYNDGTHSIEVEALENIRFPKQRFDRPVLIGIFVYGDLLQESEPAGGQLETLPMSALPTDIRFEDRGTPAPQHGTPFGSGAHEVGMLSRHSFGSAAGGYTQAKVFYVRAPQTTTSSQTGHNTIDAATTIL